MNEHDIQNLIQIALSENSETQCRVFRANVGKVKTIDGRWFDTGLPKGFPDLFGFTKTGLFFAIEVKSKTGRIRDDQIRFHNFLSSWNIVHGIARSTDDALKIVNERLVGYGY